MTRDDIIRMAQEAGWPKATLDVIVDTEMDRLERFATLVAQAEREECAKVCEAKVGDKPADPAFGDARDAADYTEWEALTKAAAAIRSRGKA